MKAMISYIALVFSFVGVIFVGVGGAIFVGVIGSNFNILITLLALMAYCISLGLYLFMISWLTKNTNLFNYL